jgi:cytochrome b
MQLTHGVLKLEGMKRNILVWDLPTRLFHWTLAGSFLGAYAIAVSSDDDGALFVAHMLLGAVAAFAVTLRLLWGLVGSRYARFASFVPGLGKLVGYVKGLFDRGGERYIGHNPGSTFAIYGMLLATLAVATSGALIGTYGDAAEEVHEVFAHGLFALSAIHLAGVVTHTLRRRDGALSSMIDGRKEGRPEQGIRSAHPVVGLVFLGLTAAWGASLVGGYDAASGTVTLPVVGQVVTLGEPEEGRAGGAGQPRGEEREGDDDDD